MTTLADPACILFSNAGGASLDLPLLPVLISKNLNFNAVLLACHASYNDST